MRDDANLADLDSWQGDEIEETFRRLRREEPVSWHEHPDSGRGFWSVVRYEDVRAAAKDTDRYSNAEGVRINYDPELSAKALSYGSLIELDPPKHTAFRKIVWSVFSPRAIAQMQANVTRRCHEILEPLRDEQTFDFIDRVAEVLPSTIICDLLNVPEQDRDLMRRIVSVNIGSSDPEVGQSLQSGTDAVDELRDYAMREVTRRRSKPGEDLLSQLVEAQVDGRRLTDDELMSFYTLLISGGIDTVRNTLSHAIVAFSEFPDQRAALMADPQTNVKTMVEEVLRWASTVRCQRRSLVEDVVLGDVSMNAGDKVVLWYSSANRDESVFEDPYSFDIMRNPNPHMTFGAGGPHFCLGAHLGRMELGTMLVSIFERFPDIAPVTPMRKVRSNQFHAAKDLIVAC